MKKKECYGKKMSGVKVEHIVEKVGKATRRARLERNMKKGKRK